MQTKQMKREKAASLAQYRAARTDEQQLFYLDNRPGNATKERARLEARISSKKEGTQS